MHDCGGSGHRGPSLLTFRFLARDVANVPLLPIPTEAGQIALVDAVPMEPEQRRGKVLFTSSSPVKHPTLSGNREAACSSCHPNGGNDGTVWGTMEGERRTIGLWGGLAGRGWLHASATHASGIEFATVIVKQRLGGTGPAGEYFVVVVLYMQGGGVFSPKAGVDYQAGTMAKVKFDGKAVDLGTLDLKK